MIIGISIWRLIFGTTGLVYLNRAVLYVGLKILFCLWQVEVQVISYL